jgi:hypothetical protein
MQMFSADSLPVKVKYFDGLLFVLLSKYCDEVSAPKFIA